MAVRVKQSGRLRPGGRARIRSNFPNKRLTITVPRGQRIKIKA